MEEQDQYKESARILNVELMAKVTLLEQETRRCAELAKANTNLTTELAALCEQTEQPKADAVAEFWTSQPYYDECNGYYGDRFDDCLKQVAVVYPDLDLSQVVINDTVPPTLGGSNTVINKTDASVHTVEKEVKEPTETKPTIRTFPMADLFLMARSLQKARLPPKVCLLLTNPLLTFLYFSRIPSFSLALICCKSNFETMVSPILGIMYKHLTSSYLH